MCSQFLSALSEIINISFHQWILRLRLSWCCLPVLKQMDSDFTWLTDWLTDSLMTCGEQKPRLPPFSPELREQAECGCSSGRDIQQWRPSRTRPDWRGRTGNSAWPPPASPPSRPGRGRAEGCQHRWSSGCSPASPSSHRSTSASADKLT